MTHRFTTAGGQTFCRECNGEDPTLPCTPSPARKAAATKRYRALTDPEYAAALHETAVNAGNQAAASRRLEAESGPRDEHGVRWEDLEEPDDV